ncbi:MAG: hypothetical protein V2A34_08450 [Lentisphaerota bacterium]
MTQPDRQEKKVEQELEAEVSRETSVHGQNWAGMYDGYFSDPSIAQPFVEEVLSVAGTEPPECIVDLGGGTGFLLGQVLRQAPDGVSWRLLDMDLSEVQLAQVKDPRIATLRQSMMEFTRDSLGAGKDATVLFITRSTLHYAGLFGLEPLLKHIRAQMRAGEYFIHHTVCCEAPEEALLLSELFERMGTGKWIPPVKSIESCCRQAGMEVIRERPMAPLVMAASVVGERYKQAPERMREIGQTLESGYEHPSLVQDHPSGYVFSAPYKLFTCRAV